MNNLILNNFSQIVFFVIALLSFLCRESCMFRKTSLLVIGCFVCSTLFAEGKDENSEMKFFQGSFLNVKGAHMRGDNTYPFGPKNTSMVCFNPFLDLGNLVIDADFSYGRSTKYAGFLKSAKGMSRITGNLPEFFDNYYDAKIDKAAQKGFADTMDKSHFYRSYTRAIYNDKAHNIQIIVGDVATRNTIGFQQPFSGGGINIARQGGNGNVINPGLPIFISKLSKAEVRLGDEILRVVILPPGTYTVDRLCEEATLPGVTVKISDQVSRSETFTVDYFSGYDMPDLGTDDFDLTMAFIHHYDVNDPYKIRYRNKPRFSGNYRFTPIENITFAFGAQGYNNSYGLDFNVIFKTPFGKIAPNVGFTDTYQGKRAGGVGIFYAAPENSYGIHFEAMLSAKGRGYGDLKVSEEESEDYDYYMDKYFPTLANDFNLKNGSSLPQTSRSVMVRLYSDPIYGYTPGFTFVGDWANNHDGNTNNYRDYSVSLTKSPFDGCVVTAVAGLTYDDPTKGRNQKSPDRRLTLACSINLNSEISLKGTYSHLDMERMKKYGSITYTPEAIKGLEVQAEYFRMPGKSCPVFSVKYDNEYFGVKIEENIADSYADKRAATKDGHKNNQSILLGTSLTPKGFRAVKKNDFNVIRTAEDFRK